MQDHLSISDSSVTIGEPRLVLANPTPPSEPYLPPSSYTSLIAYLEQRIALLETQVVRLDMEVALLQQQTFWTLFKAQLRSFWRSLRGR